MQIRWSSPFLSLTDWSRIVVLPKTFLFKYFHAWNNKMTLMRIKMRSKRCMTICSVGIFDKDKVLDYDWRWKDFKNEKNETKLFEKLLLFLMRYSLCTCFLQTSAGECELFVYIYSIEIVRILLPMSV